MKFYSLKDCVTLMRDANFCFWILFYTVYVYSKLDNTCRSVHGLGRVRFVPNLDSTRPSRVGKISTRNQPGCSFRSSGLGRIGFQVFLSRFRVFKFRWFWPKSGGISSDLAGSNEIWPIFLRIYGNMAEIWQRSKGIWSS